jgi:integrase
MVRPWLCRVTARGASKVSRGLPNFTPLDFAFATPARTRSTIIDRSNSAIAAMMVNTGCREDEICKLEWSDVSFKEGLVHIRKKKVVENRRKADGQVETREYEWKPKASQGDVPMNKTVKALLQRLHSARTSNFVFAQDDGGSCRVRLLRLTQRAAKQAGIKRIRFHDLRHTYGTLLREKGVPLETIMQLMRHADIEETMLYAKPSNQAAHEAAKRLEVA